MKSGKTRLKHIDNLYSGVLDNIDDNSGGGYEDEIKQVRKGVDSLCEAYCYLYENEKDE